MQNSPLISVIIPTKNVANTLRQTLESVVNQTYANIEVLVVDYQSTDETQAIATSFDNVRFIPEISPGIYQAMNTGIAQANGTWLYFLGADDVLFDEHVFTSIFSQPIPNTCYWILGKVENVSVTNSFIKTIYTNTLTSGIYWRNILHHQGILYHKEVFRTEQYDTRFAVLADYAFNLKLYLSGVKSYQSNCFIAKSNAEGISKQFTHALYNEELALKNELLPIIPKIINWFVIKGKRWMKVKG